MASFSDRSPSLTTTDDITLQAILKDKYFDAERIARAVDIVAIRPSFTEIYTTKKYLRCYSLSDMHADSEKGQKWVKDYCTGSHKSLNALEQVFTVFIVPGDVGSDMHHIESVFHVLTERYDAVCYVPGNHEAWVRGYYPDKADPTLEREIGVANIPGSSALASDSVTKLVAVLHMAQAMGVHTGPLRVKCGADRDRCVHSTLPGAKRVTPQAEHTPSPVIDGKSSLSPVAPADPVPVPAAADDDDGTGAGDGLLIVPLHAWYHSCWDTEPDLSHPLYLAAEENVPFVAKWSDFRQCVWPKWLLPNAEDFTTLATNVNGVQRGVSSTVLAEAFAKCNEAVLFPVPSIQPCEEKNAVAERTKKTNENNNNSSRNNSDNDNNDETPLRIFGTPLAKPGDTIISFSHYLPRVECNLEKRFMTVPMLSKVVGSAPLEAQIRRLQPDLHLFGHTHVPIDVEVDGLRYVQWPLGYYRESKLQCTLVHQIGPLLVFDNTESTAYASFQATSAPVHAAAEKEAPSFSQKEREIMTTTTPQALRKSRGIPAKMDSENAVWSKYYRGNHDSDVRAKLGDAGIPMLAMEKDNYDENDDQDGVKSGGVMGSAVRDPGNVRDLAPWLVKCLEMCAPEGVTYNA